MSQRPHTPPFHRRILPWIFVVMFIAIAPAVVFYTAGYRWNSKKGKVERHGTVILDTIPSSARVTIDERPIHKTTPITLQEMSPGLHRFQFDLDGYHSWQKTLDVRSERVTFANAVQLWKNTLPMRVQEQPSLALGSHPKQPFLLSLTQSTPTQAVLYTKEWTIQRTIPLPFALEHPPQFSWSPDGRFVLLEAAESSSRLILLDLRGTYEPLLLPFIAYRWEKDTLIGHGKDARYTIRLSTGEMNTFPLARSQPVDLLGDSVIRSVTGTQQLAYFSSDDTSRGVILPNGNWRFWEKQNDLLILRAATRWLAFSPSQDQKGYQLLSGDLLRSLSRDQGFAYLSLQGGELWLWNPSEEPSLLYRHSEPFIEVQWHRSGSNIFYATSKGLFALQLDPRGGYVVTPLATFDHLSSFTVFNRNLYLAATREGKTGIWELRVE